MNGSLLLREVFLPGMWALEATAILVAAWLLGRCMRRNAALRHLTWLMAFAALPLIPLVNALVPTRYTLSIPLPPAQWETPVEAPSDELARYVASLQPSMPVRMGLNVTPRTTAPAPPVEPAPPASSRFDTRGLIRWMVGIWLAGVAIVLLQGVCALYGLRRLRRRSVATSMEVAKSAALGERLGLRRRCELRVSVTRVPPSAMTWGFLRPVILLPRDSTDWSADQWEAVLLHEMAHVRRGDSLSQLFTLCVCALYWFHPAVWRCARAMQADAEMAADDTVLRSGLTPSSYAAALLRFASERGPQRQPFARIGVSMLKQSRIESRIQSIVNPTHRRGVTLMETVKVVGCSLAGVLLLALARPAVSFAENQAPGQAVSAAQASAEDAPRASDGDVQVSEAKSAAPAIAVAQSGTSSRAVPGRAARKPAARAAQQAPVVAAPARAAKPADVALPVQVARPGAIARPADVARSAAVASPAAVARPGSVATAEEAAAPAVAAPAALARPGAVALPADVAVPREAIAPDVDVKPLAVAPVQEAKPAPAVRAQKSIKPGTEIIMPIGVKRPGKPGSEIIMMPVKVRVVQGKGRVVSSAQEAKPLVIAQPAEAVEEGIVKRSQPVKVEVKRRVLAPVKVQDQEQRVKPTILRPQVQLKPQSSNLIVKPAVNLNTQVAILDARSAVNITSQIADQAVNPSVNVSPRVILKPSVASNAQVILKPSVNHKSQVILKPSVANNAQVILKPSVNRKAQATMLLVKPTVNLQSNVVLKPSVAVKEGKTPADNRGKRVNRFDAWGEPQ